MVVRLALILALALSVLPSGVARAEGLDVQLAVPYRSQLDDTPYARANCGPASVAMVLEAFGMERRTHDLRGIANRLQATYGYDDGIAIEHLATVVVMHGLLAYDLYRGSDFRRWTLDDARAHLRAGRPVIPQVWYRALPGRFSSTYQFDHYVVLVGTVGDDFLYHDSIDHDGPGALRRISALQLTKAWRSSDVPWGAFAVGPAGDSPLRPRPAPAKDRLMLLQQASIAETLAALPDRTLVPNTPWRVLAPPDAEPAAARSSPSSRGVRWAAPDDGTGPLAPAPAGERGAALLVDVASPTAAVAPRGPLATLAAALRQIVKPLARIAG